MLLLVEAMRTVHTQHPVPQVQPALTAGEQASLVQVFAATYLYAAMANVFCQDLLPSSIASVGNELRRLIDMTAADVATLDMWLATPTEQWSDAARALRDEATTHWKPHVRDTLGAYQARDAAQTAPAPAPASE